MIRSGRITVFFGSIASAKMGGEAKLVQRGTIRGRIFYRRGRGNGRDSPTEGGSATGGCDQSLLTGPERGVGSAIKNRIAIDPD